MRRLLSVLRLWILALPLLLIGFGAGLNQIVLAANHDTFPVMVNHRKEVHFQPDQWGQIDDNDHCVMTGETHLNWLADYIDLQEAIYSPGDLVLMLGEWLWSFAPIVWLTLVFTDLWRRAEVK